MAQLTDTKQLISQSVIGSYSGHNVYIRLYAWETELNSVNSTGKVSLNIYLYMDASSAYTITTYDGVTSNISGIVSASEVLGGQQTIVGGQEKLILAKDVTLQHNADGTKTGTMTATANFSNWFSGSTSASVTARQIPRYASITSFTVSKRTENSLTFSWSASNTVDYLWYSINNGSSWTGLDVTDGTSGSFVVSSLSPNTTYSCKIRIRRKDSQLTTDSGTVNQTTYKVPTQSFSSKTETTITMSWAIDSTANYIWYSKDNGANWIAVGSVNATSGSYTISGLNANTSYTIKTRVRRSATNTTYDTSAVTQTTYNYPYITAVQTSNLIVGGSQKLTLYNPLSRNVTIKMYKNNYGGTELYSGTTTGTSLTFTPTASTLYASIPSNVSSNCVYSVIYGSVVRTTSQYTYSINVNENKPIFSNFAYSTNLSNLTGDNDTIINGETTTTVTISSANKAVAKNSASITKYSVQIGSMTPVIVNYSTSDVSTNIAKCNSTIIRVTAIDSRNLETTVTKTISNFKDYFMPTFALTSAEREDGVEANGYLDLTLNFWNKNFGVKQNTIKEIRYRTKQSSSSTWSDWTLDAFKIDLSQLVINNNEAKLENYPIYTDGVSADFEIGKTYDLQLKVIDGSNTNVLNEVISNIFTLTDGKVAFSILRDNNGEYHIGINGMPDLDYNLKVHGTINNS